MIRTFNDENDKRLRTISWLKEHINEFNDSDKVLLLDKNHETVMTKILNSCPSEEELELEDAIQLEAAKRALAEATKENS